MTMIKLAPLEWAEWNEYRKAINDDEIAHLVDRYLPVTETEHRKFYETLLKDKSRVFFSVYDTGVSKSHCVGIAALKNIDLRVRKTELYICLNKRGKGYGVKTVEALLNFAFDSLNMNRVYLYTPAYNKAALACYKKAGFRKEGEFLDDVFSRGKLHNSVRMCFLRRFRKKI
jgi:diamine N-acetyltransferase